MSTVLAGLSFAAYIDPSAGGYLVQMLVAGLLGGTYALREHLRRAYRWLRRRMSKVDDGQ